MLKVSTAQATRFGVFQVLKSSSFYGKDSTAKSAAAGAAAGAASVFAFQVLRLMYVVFSVGFCGLGWVGLARRACVVPYLMYTGRPSSPC